MSLTKTQGKQMWGGVVYRFDSYHSDNNSYVLRVSIDGRGSTNHFINYKDPDEFLTKGLACLDSDNNVLHLSPAFFKTWVKKNHAFNSESMLEYIFDIMKWSPLERIEYLDRIGVNEDNYYGFCGGCLGDSSGVHA